MIEISIWGRVFAWVVVVSGICGLTSSSRGQAPTDRLKIELSADELDTDWIVTGGKIERQDDSLRLAEGDGFVRLPHALRDFEFSFSFKPEKETGWDSGLYFRSELPSDKSPWPQRYQINLLDGHEGELIGHSSGKVPAGLIRPGDWNHFHLTVVGPMASLRINDQPAWTVHDLEPMTGYLGFQSEVPLGGAFLFKDIALVELNGRPLFNGTDLTGWTPVGGDSNESWIVRDRMLLCTGAKGSWLRLDEPQSDFNLRMEYRLKPAGNSGVYIRVPKDGNHHGDDSGIEVQILDDRDPKYKDLKPYQRAGSLYAIVPADPQVGRKAGQWNQLEIDARGEQYRIWHNGILVIDASAETTPELTQRLSEGFLGLQNHSEEVWFRRLRISESFSAKE